VAFSRDQEKKVYVTHLLEQDSDLIWEVIGEKKGHFYICGYVVKRKNNLKERHLATPFFYFQ
jgi:hypothetical protein